MKADTIIYRASQLDSERCSMKERRCPNTPFRKIARSIHKAAREETGRIAKTPEYSRSCHERKKAERYLTGVRARVRVLAERHRLRHRRIEVSVNPRGHSIKRNPPGLSKKSGTSWFVGKPSGQKHLPVCFGLLA